MPNQVENKLNESQFSLLQAERYMLLSTIDFEKNIPMMNAISWIYAPTPNTLVFAVDNRSRILTNILHNTNVTFTLIGDGSTYSIGGRAKVVFEKMKGIPLKLAKVEVEIDEVRDVMFYGSKITSGPEYEKTYDLNAASNLDSQVMEALKIV
ncbi:pyridoxamine 5'-phosphate oxidase family protein [Bacillaceae bacterium S4-13-58]